MAKAKYGEQCSERNGCFYEFHHKIHCSVLFPLSRRYAVRRAFVSQRVTGRNIACRPDYTHFPSGSGDDGCLA